MSTAIQRIALGAKSSRKLLRSVLAVNARFMHSQQILQQHHQQKQSITHEPKNQQSSDHAEISADGVEPEVSPYAIGATVFFIGGFSYYLYAEYGKHIKSYLPWLPSRNSDELAEKDKEARAESRRQRRLRAQMEPTSDMSPVEQVNWAWTHPGLYVTGSNKNGLIDPLHPGSANTLKASVVGLDGKLIRDAVFAETHAAALDSKGNLYQWGSGFIGNSTPHRPICTKKDSGIASLAASSNYIITLDTRSRIRAIRGNKHSSDCDEILLEFESRLGWREHIVSISAGSDHVSAVSSYGNVYTASLGPAGNSRSQLGRNPASASPVDPFKFKRIESDKRFVKAECGMQHTLLLTDDGEVYGCGANDFGQLSMGDYTPANATINTIKPLQWTYTGNSQDSEHYQIKDIAAGANTSYVVTDGSNDKGVCLFACGNGINGQLGNGTLPHIQGRMTKIDVLSGQWELDPATHTRVPVGIRSLSTHGDHVLAIRNNHTNIALDKSGNSVSKMPLYGYDVLVWGNNSSGQCIPDRKHRFPSPEYPPPLYTTKNANESPAPGQIAARLQAAPKQWVLSSDFKRLDPQIASGKHLVEQKFVAGYNVTAAFLRPVN